MKPGIRFDTGVEGAWGYVPEPPASWSFSSLKDAETCPRRWMLSRAKYPDVWDKGGYPQRPNPAALLGDVVHGAIEVIIDALNVAGCTTLDAPDSVHVLRGLGGLSAVVREVIDRIIDDLKDNPRVNNDAREGTRQLLVDQIGLASNRIQLLLSRSRLPAWSGDKNVRQRDGHGGRGEHRRSPVDLGGHTEIDVVAEDLRLSGRIDLVTKDESGVTITDFKTGQEDPSHDDQVRMYALLWDLDRERNPERSAADVLVVSYPGQSRIVPTPGPVALRSLELETRTRIEQADSQATASAPARPGPDTCQFCQVRHLCADYWQTVVPDPATVTPNEWFDFEGSVLRQNGLKSWVVIAGLGGTEVLVRTQSPSTALPLGRTIRVLGARRVGDSDDPGRVIAALGSNSENFALNDSA